jgi:putative ABC transport system permease protein
VASLLILSAVASAMLWGLKRATRSTQQSLPAVVRHGIANIYRPGNQAAALLVALGLGVMFTLTVYLVQKSMLVQIASSAPPGMPNVFLINITAKERDGIAALLESHPGMRNKPEVVPITAARIVKINGAPIEQRQLTGFRRRFMQTRSVSWAKALPPQSAVLEGKFWDASTKGVEVCLNEDAAKTLQANPGDTIEWSASSKSISSTVACIYRSDSVRIGSNFDFLFNPGALDGLPTLHFAAVRMDPAQIAPLQRAVFAKFPTVTVINGADVLAIIQEVVDQIALVIRFISFFAILAGAIILASSVAGTRFRRVREVVILKTLGATRRRIGSIFSIEFLILGAAAGVLGSLLATAFSLLVLKRLFQVDYSFDPLPHLIAVVMTALLANAAGWSASHRILQQKPLEALRGSL